jgi:hypothetical protein
VRFCENDIGYYIGDNRADIYGNEVAWQARDTLAANIESLRALDELASSPYTDTLSYIESQIVREDLKCGFVSPVLPARWTFITVIIGTPWRNF